MIDLTIIDEIILRSLKEDMPMGDITTDSTVPENEVIGPGLLQRGLRNSRN